MGQKNFMGHKDFCSMLCREILGVGGPSSLLELVPRLAIDVSKDSMCQSKNDWPGGVEVDLEAPFMR